jgi:hypothetical protein
VHSRVCVCVLGSAEGWRVVLCGSLGFRGVAAGSE